MNLLNIGNYSVVQNATAGTTIMTINATDISRDNGSWACQYGNSNVSQAVSLLVGTPPSIITTTEGPETVVIQTGCTYPAVIINVICSSNGASLSFTNNVSSNGSTCTDPNEAAFTVTLSLEPTQSVTGPGFITVNVSNGIYTASRTGSRLYFFGLTTTTTTSSIKKEKFDDIIIGCAVGVFIGLCLLVIAAILIYKYIKKKGKPEDDNSSQSENYGNKNKQQNNGTKSKTEKSNLKLSMSDVSRRDVQIQMEGNGVKSKEERPQVKQNRIGIKYGIENESVQAKNIFDLNRSRPLPPQPITSEKNYQNLRGLSANYEDLQGIASYTPRPKLLPPIQHQLKSTI